MHTITLGAFDFTAPAITDGLGDDDEMGADEMGGYVIAEVGDFTIDEFGGFSFKKFTRGLKKGLRAVGRVAKAGLKVAMPVAAVASIVVPGVGTAIGGALVAADRLIAAAEKGGKAASDAKKIFTNTQKLAALGHPGAQRGIKAIAAVHTQRRRVGAVRGQPQPLSAKGKASVAAYHGLRRRALGGSSKPVVLSQRNAALSRTPVRPVTSSRPTLQANPAAQTGVSQQIATGYLVLTRKGPFGERNTVVRHGAWKPAT